MGLCHGAVDCATEELRPISRRDDDGDVDFAGGSPSRVLARDLGGLQGSLDATEAGSRPCSARDPSR